MLSQAVTFQKSMKSHIIYLALQMQEEHLKTSNTPINLSKAPTHLERLQFVRIKMSHCAMLPRCLHRTTLNIYKRNRQKLYESHRASSSCKLTPLSQAKKIQYLWMKASNKFQPHHSNWDRRTRNCFSSLILTRRWSILSPHQGWTLRVWKREKNTLMS